MRGTVRLTVSSVLGRKLVVPALAEFATLSRYCRGLCANRFTLGCDR